jgi:Alpha-glutamyl/putrescinyl thymine pyrophosphorylase clade 2
MHKAAANDNLAPPTDTRWPRGTERRHFRGPKCVSAIEWFERQWASPEAPVRLLTLLPTEKIIIAKVSEWPMFGPWIGFKAADLIERVYGVPIQFDPNLGLMYSSPRDALDLLSETPDFIAVDRAPVALYNNLITFFSGQRAPPSYNRQCNAQEVETILCKWGSMKSGHYWVGKDIKEVREALHRWGSTAERILSVMPEEG